MLLSHAITLAEARSHLAALADRTDSLDVSEEYDRALLYLDAIHGAVVPALGELPIADTDVVYQLAVQAIESLRTYGVDALQVEIVLAMIADAHCLDLIPWAGEASRGDQLDAIASDPFEFDWESRPNPQAGGGRNGSEP